MIDQWNILITMNKYLLLFCISLFFSNIILTEKLSLKCDSSELSSIEIENKELIEDGIKVIPTFAAFLKTDSYSNITTKDCKNSICADVYNRKWCKEPKEEFVIKSLNNNNSVIVVSNRCDGGFKKYSSPLKGKLDFPIKYLDDKFLFQVQNQIHAGTYLQRSPVIRIDKDDEGFHVTIKDFTEDDWDKEWTREDISLSYFTVEEENAFSFNSRCISN